MTSKTVIHIAPESVWEYYTKHLEDMDVFGLIAEDDLKHALYIADYGSDRRPCLVVYNDEDVMAWNFPPQNEEDMTFVIYEILSKYFDDGEVTYSFDDQVSSDDLAYDPVYDEWVFNSEPYDEYEDAPIDPTIDFIEMQDERESELRSAMEDFVQIALEKDDFGVRLEDAEIDYLTDLVLELIADRFDCGDRIYRPTSFTVDGRSYCSYYPYAWHDDTATLLDEALA